MSKLIVFSFVILMMGMTVLAQDKDPKLPKNWQQKADTCWMANPTGDLYVSIGTGISDDIAQAKNEAYAKCKQLVQGKLDVPNTKMSLSPMDEDKTVNKDNQFVIKLAVKVRLSP